ncbi:MAG: DUF1961 family protein [Kiritimatiellia bacterium]
MTEFKEKELLYENGLGCSGDISSWRVEGEAAITFPRGRMRMENAKDRDKETGIHGNFILWCNRSFPDHIAVRWDFRPLTDRGLAMIWIAAGGRKGEDLFDPALAERDGDYPQYHHGDINALHGSYFRRNPSEIPFRTCNLRKSYGFHMVCQGADPLPDSAYATGFYRMEVIKSGRHFRFSINNLLIYHWVDDGESYGPVLEGGKIGFRQMAGLIADYGNLEVWSVEKAKE